MCANKVAKQKHNKDRFFSSTTEFVMVHGTGASDSRPFSFNATAMNAVGYPDRLFQNVVLMPTLTSSKLRKAGPDMAKPKSVVDKQQQSPFTWMNVFLNFCELHTSDVILNIGSSVGVGFLLCLFSFGFLLLTFYCLFLFLPSSG